MNTLQFWKLQDNPFEELADTRFFFESTEHREALDRMLYILKDRNMSMSLLTGEIGSGKTITRNVFRNKLNRNLFEIIILENSFFSFNDIVYDIIKNISFCDPRLSFDEITPDRKDKYQLIECFKRKLDNLIYQERRHLVIILDEAQTIETSVLDEIKQLTNISSESKTYMSIFLIGQPELREKIRQLKQIDQRIFLRFHINHFDYNSMISYIHHRLAVAGWKGGTIFTTAAHELIYKTTNGIPRQINRLCKLSLAYAFANESHEITENDVSTIVEDIELNG